MTKTYIVSYRCLATVSFLPMKARALRMMDALM